MILSSISRFLSRIHGRCVCCEQPAYSRLFPNGRACLCTDCIDEILCTPQQIEIQEAPYASIFTYGVYEGILQRIIPEYKYEAKLYYAPLLADCILFTFASLITEHYDYCLPIPQHKDKIQRRGFYHLGLLADYITRYTTIPTPRTYIHVVKNYVSQQLLSRDERLSNVRNVFGIRHALHGKRILILDDVITTGATITAVAQLLSNAGVYHIDCIAIAINKRGILSHKSL
ncbi:MAG: hypothetical protein K2M30_02950 [Desulfovibrionaceae bacterium]|nr:hypothetical protein [Desulfovibrionaceae bacterium]